MPEHWVSSEARRHLRGRRKTDTRPELLLRSALHALGARYRLHRQIAKGCTPDIVLPARRLAVFVDGDYWHSCPIHRLDKTVRGPNAELWERKFTRNKERDRLATQLAETAGWRVVRVWECAVRHDPRAAARQVIAGISPPPHAASGRGRGRRGSSDS